MRKCQNCGTLVSDDKFICENCGQEIFQVPHYEPEIEMEIDNNISRIINSKTIDLTDNTQDLSNTNKSFNLFFISILFVFIIVFSILFFILYRSNSAAYQLNLANMAIDNGDMDKGIEYLKKAIILSEGDINTYDRLADIYLAKGDYDKACEVYRNYLFISPDDLNIYLKIISIYKENNEYDKINLFLQLNSSEANKEIFEEYITKEVEFDMEEGEYIKSLMLSLEAPSSGSIYYTLDGSLPDDNSLIYERPIQLKKGDYRVCAIYKNQYGVTSKPVIKEYSILANAPGEPELSLAEGSYDYPQLIGINIPENSFIYYTLDGSIPSTLSHIYGEPIALKEGNTILKIMVVSEGGEESEIFDYNFELKLNAALDQNACYNALLSQLMDINYISNIDGSLENAPGKYIYYFKELRSISGINMYCFNEYYVKGSGRDMTNNFFGVDYMSGTVYRIIKDSSLNYSIVPLN